MVANWIFDWAERTPDKVAIVHNDRPFTYSQFARLITRARGFFHGEGLVGSGVVPVMLSNLMAFWFVSVALRSLGFTTITARSAAGLAGLDLKDIAFVVTVDAEDWPGLAELCEAKGWRRVALAMDDAEDLPPDAGPGLLDGGHILATSGTTGAHKKILRGPANEPSVCEDSARLRDLDGSSVEAAFDFGGWTGAGYTCAVTLWRLGGTILYDQTDRTDRLLARRDVTAATVTPGLLNILLAAAPGAYPRNERLTLSVTSGSITQAQIDAIKARITPHLVNRIGSTEGGIITSTPINTPDDHRWHILAPGRVIHIVDDDDQPVPVGQVGQLRVELVNLKGYVDDEEATAQFFRDGFFYPGDLAVAREDGRIALQGRITDVINVAGAKISPAPIEDALRGALGVAGVCLFTQQNDTGEEQVHVAIEPAKPVPLDALVAVLRVHIPVFPGAHVHYVEALPRDAAGKLQRREARALALGLPTA